MSYWNRLIYEINNKNNPNMEFFILDHQLDEPKPKKQYKKKKFSNKPLSPREKDVVKYIKKELSNYQIAVRMGITKRTVDSYISSIFDKLDIQNRKQLLKMEL